MMFIFYVDLNSQWQHSSNVHPEIEVTELDAGQ